MAHTTGHRARAGGGPLRGSVLSVVLLRWFTVVKLLVWVVARGRLYRYSIDYFITSYFRFAYMLSASYDFYGVYVYMS